MEPRIHINDNQSLMNFNFVTGGRIHEDDTQVSDNESCVCDEDCGEERIGDVDDDVVALGEDEADSNGIRNKSMQRFRDIGKKSIIKSRRLVRMTDIDSLLSNKRLGVRIASLMNKTTIGGSRAILSTCETPDKRQRKSSIVGIHKKPKSPWLPFSILISRLTKILTPEQTDFILKEHKNFKERKITRMELIETLKRIVGVDLLVKLVKHCGVKERALINSHPLSSTGRSAAKHEKAQGNRSVIVPQSVQEECCVC